ncbi:hypothetical protein LTS10_010866 [Elasticomyces elasticus]|nr:hypothetical protein LTS10_010866 [Elasticomyces elasticus]
MLGAHLRWDYYEPSEFSSWSVSLLRVLVHAVRKTTPQNGYVGESLDDILIYVLDTENIAAPHVHRSKDLIPIFDLGDIKYIDSYSQGEYLVHGRLQDQDTKLFKAVTLSQLINAGLYLKFPELKPQPDAGPYRLYLRALELRATYFASDL